MKTSGSLLVVEKEKIDKENDKIKNDNNSLEKINIQTLNGFLFYLGFPLDPTRKDLIEKLFKSKMEIKEKKPSKIKKMELQMKLDGQGFENSPLLISKKNLKKEKSPEVANKYKNDEQNPENIVINDKKEEINEA